MFYSLCGGVVNGQWFSGRRPPDVSLSSPACDQLLRMYHIKVIFALSYVRPENNMIK